MCGAPFAPMIESRRVTTRPGVASKCHAAANRDGEIGSRDPGRHVAETICHGYRQTCGCPPAPPGRSVVLDPFSGIGTTGQTAVYLGHDYIGCELNPEYAAISERRIQQTPRWALRLQAKAERKRKSAERHLEFRQLPLFD